MDPTGSHQGPSGLRHDISPPNVAAMNVMSLNPLATGFGFGVPGSSPGGLMSPMHSTGNSGGIYQPSSIGQSMTPGSQLYLSTGPSHHPSSFTPPQSAASSLHGTSPYSPMQSPGIGTSGSAAAFQMGGPGLNGMGSKLGGGRHLCAICEDAASGKHYGVYRLDNAFRWTIVNYCASKIIMLTEESHNYCRKLVCLFNTVAVMFFYYYYCSNVLISIWKWMNVKTNSNKGEGKHQIRYQ